MSRYVQNIRQLEFVIKNWNILNILMILLGTSRAVITATHYAEIHDCSPFKRPVVDCYWSNLPYWQVSTNQIIRAVCQLWQFCAFTHTFVLSLNMNRPGVASATETCKLFHLANLHLAALITFHSSLCLKMQNKSGTWFTSTLGLCMSAYMLFIRFFWSYEGNYFFAKFFNSDYFFCIFQTVKRTFLKWLPCPERWTPIHVKIILCTIISKYAQCDPYGLLGVLDTSIVWQLRHSAQSSRRWHEKQWQ
jgi:hypothetical protein